MSRGGVLNRVTSDAAVLRAGLAYMEIDPPAAEGLLGSGDWEAARAYADKVVRALVEGQYLGAAALGTIGSEWRDLVRQTAHGKKLVTRAQQLPGPYQIVGSLPAAWRDWADWTIAVRLMYGRETLWFMDRVHASVGVRMAREARSRWSSVVVYGADRIVALPSLVSMPTHVRHGRLFVDEDYRPVSGVVAVPIAHTHIYVVLVMGIEADSLGVVLDVLLADVRVRVLVDGVSMGGSIRELRAVPTPRAAGSVMRYCMVLERV
jgi:hypothetical protein